MKYKMKRENKVNIISTEKRGRMYILIALLLLAVIVGIIVGVMLHNKDITAVSMRIQRLVGTVNLFDESGSEKDILEQMRLASGYNVTTADESLITISLDDIKLVTLEESSRAAVNAKGQALELNLVEGNLYFNVTKKLEDGESFDVTTTDIMCGIRGTSAYVGQDSTGHTTLMVTDGDVDVVAKNPGTLEQLEMTVSPGQMITIYLDEEAEGDATVSVNKQKFREEDLPPIALDTMRKDPELMERVTQSTGFSPEKIEVLAVISSVPGESMYGEAAQALASAGIGDSVPLMGYHAEEMVKAANCALDIAEDDLELEVAILKGLRDVIDVGKDADYDSEQLSDLMQGAKDCVSEICAEAKAAGLNNKEMIDVVAVVSETMQNATSEMTVANLTVAEVGEVLTATTQLFTEAIVTAAADGGNKASVITAVNDTGSYVASTVNSEMQKSSGGEITAATLLEKPAEEAPRAQVPATDADTGNNAERTDAPVVPTVTAINTTSDTVATTTPAAPTAGISTVVNSVAPVATATVTSESDTSSGSPQPDPPATYTITYELDGGVINSGNITGYTAGVGATLPTDITRAAAGVYKYTFEGLFTAATGGSRVTSISASDTGNKTFYAHWTKELIDPITVTFQNYDGTVLETQTIARGDRPVYGGAVPTKEASATRIYSWSGWEVGQVWYASLDQLPTLQDDTIVVATFDETTRSYGIKQSVGENGSIRVKVGNEIVTGAYVDSTVNITVIPGSYYKASSVTVKDSDNNTVDLTVVSTETDRTTYSFTMPASVVTVSATFERDYVNLVTQPPENGSFTWSTKTDPTWKNTSVQVSPLEALFIKPVPDDGYTVDEVYIQYGPASNYQRITGTDRDGVYEMSVPADLDSGTLYVTFSELQTVTVSSVSQLNVALGNSNVGRVNLTANLWIQNDFEIPAGKIVDINGYVLSVSGGKTLTNAGTLIVPNHSYLLVASDGTLVNTGTIYDNGEIDYAGTVTGLENVTATQVVMTGYYDWSTTGATNIWYKLAGDGTLSIMGSGNMTNQVSGDPESSWTNYQILPSHTSDVTSIVIEEGITSVSMGAFQGLSAKTVTIPGSVTKIDKIAFNGSSLETVIMQEGVTTIEYEAFYNCASLKNATLADSITTIKKAAFSNCKVMDINGIPASLQTLGNEAFRNTKLSGAMVIPESCTAIGQLAFESCSGMTSITIGSGVTAIGQEVFSDCSSLESVILGSNVTAIGRYAFKNDSKLSSINMENLTTLNEYSFAQSGLENVTIPESITSIPAYCFYKCQNLEEIWMTSVSSIGAQAFSDCQKMNTIYVGESMTSAGQMAFSGCSGLTDIYYDGTQELWESKGLTNQFYTWGYGSGYTVHYGKYSINIAPNIVGGTITAVFGEMTITSSNYGSAEHGEEVVLTVTLTPETGYRFDDPGVETSDGGSPEGLTVAQGQSDGVYIVSFTMPESKVTVSALFEATTIPVKAVTLDKTNITLQVGGSDTLTATINPGNATDATVRWENKSPDVVTLTENGTTVTIQAKSAGIATITVVSNENSNLREECVVTVTE